MWIKSHLNVAYVMPVCSHYIHICIFMYFIYILCTCQSSQALIIESYLLQILFIACLKTLLKITSINYGTLGDTFSQSMCIFVMRCLYFRVESLLTNNKISDPNQLHPNNESIQIIINGIQGEWRYILAQKTVNENLPKKKSIKKPEYSYQMACCVKKWNLSWMKSIERTICMLNAIWNEHYSRMTP